MKFTFSFLSLQIFMVSAYNITEGQESGLRMLGKADVTRSVRVSSTETQTIQNLFANSGSIEREVIKTTEGVETYTHSSNGQVSSWIKKHVAEMMALKEQGSGIRLWDDLFAKAFQYHDFNTLMVTELTDDGVMAIHKVNDGLDPEVEDCVVAIIHAHAQVVSDFISIGKEEANSNHEVPDECAGL